MRVACHNEDRVISERALALDHRLKLLVTKREKVTPGVYPEFGHKVVAVFELAGVKAILQCVGFRPTNIGVREVLCWNVFLFDAVEIE